MNITRNGLFTSEFCNYGYSYSLASLMNWCNCWMISLKLLEGRLDELWEICHLPKMFDFSPLCGFRCCVYFLSNVNFCEGNFRADTVAVSISWKFFVNFSGGELAYIVLYVVC